MPVLTCFGCRRIGSDAPGGKERPNYSLRRPMAVLSAGNSNSRCSMTASSTLGRWHENPNALHLPRGTQGTNQTRRGSRRRPDRRGLEPAAGTCRDATGMARQDRDNASKTGGFKPVKLQLWLANREEEWGKKKWR